MTIAIGSISTPTFELWDEIWENCDSATYYHSRHWASLWEQYAPEKHRAAPRLVTFTDGMRALLPLTITRHGHGFIQIFESSPCNTYGGWISLDPLTQPHVNLLGEYMRTLPNMNWLTNPFDPNQLGAAGHGEATWTRVIALDEGLQALTKNARSSYRKAIKSGLELRPIQTGDLETVYQIYSQNRRRWTNQRETPFQPRLFSLFLNLERADFLGAFQADRLVATTIALRSKRHVGVWLGISSTEGLPLSPLRFIDGSLVERYSAAGFQWYDLHPSGGLENIDRAKKQTGAISMPLSIFRTKTPVYLAANWAHDVARRLLPAKAA